MPIRPDVRILIVDDHPALCQGLQVLLRSAGYQNVEGVNNGRSAVTRCDEFKPDHRRLKS